MATRTYQLIPTFNVGGQFAQSVWAWQFDDAGFSTTKGAAQALINAFDVARRATLRAMLPVGTSLLSYRGRLVQASGGFNAFSIPAGAVAGTRPGEISVSALNPVAVFYPLNPAHGRGKWFIPGVSETDIESGIYTAAYVTAINAGLGTIFDDLVLVGGGAPTARFGWIAKGPPAAFRSSIRNELSKNVGLQRRRMRPAG